MENLSLPPREHKKVNYAEFETFSDSSSENNKKQNHGNYISWSSSEDALLIEQVNKYLENQKIQNENGSTEKENENEDKNNEIDDLKNNEKDEKNNINLNKEKNLPEKTPEEKNEKEMNTILNINWNKIAEKFENKNARQCQTRWQNILDPNRVKGPWTKEEDLKLIELVKKFGPEKWSNISTYLPGRLGKQCRERWYNHLNPEVRKTGWSKEEEWALFLLHRKYGNSWSTFSEKIPGRTDNTIKNHWNSIMKKNIVSINNQYQEMIKGKTKEEIEQIEKKIMDKCNQVMNKDYNEYYQEKIKEFPIMKTTKFGKKYKDKIHNENNNINNIEYNVINDNNNTDIKKTPEKIKKKIFENIKVKKELVKSPKNKSKNKTHEKNEDSKEKKHKNNKKQNSAKKADKYLNINDDKELKILKSGEKVLQKDKNILIKEAENKFKEKQKLKKEEKKSKLKYNYIKTEENEENNNYIENIPTYSNKNLAKKPKRKLGRPKKLSSKKNKTKFNVSKLSSHNKENKERDSPNINNININQHINFQNTFINPGFNNNQINPNPIYSNSDGIKNNNINIPYPIYPNEKFPFYAEEDKDFTKMNFNKILITDSKDINKSKKEAPFPFKVPPTAPFFRSDIKNSSESSGGNNSLGKLTPDFRMNPPFIPSNDKYYLLQKNGPLFFNSNPKQMGFVRGVNNNNNNKISTDSNSIHSYSMNQSMLSANSAFKKSSSGSGSGSGRSFQPRANVFNFNNMADLNKEFFSNNNLEEKNFK